MKDKFCTYEIALKLKELDFDDECFGFYYSDKELCIGKTSNQNNYVIDSCLAPLYQDVIKWIFKRLDYYYPYLTITLYSDGSGSWDENEGFGISFNTIEEAVLLGIKEIEKQIK